MNTKINFSIYSKTALLVFLVSSLFLLGMTFSGDKSDSMDTCTLEGKVYAGMDKKPLAGAIVKIIHRESKEEHTYITGTAGKYEFDMIEVNTNYDLYAAKEGFYTGEQLINIRPEDCPKTTDFYLSAKPDLTSEKFMKGETTIHGDKEGGETKEMIYESKVVPNKYKVTKPETKTTTSSSMSAPAAPPVTIPASSDRSKGSREYGSYSHYTYSIDGVKPESDYEADAPVYYSIEEPASYGDVYLETEIIETETKMDGDGTKKSKAKIKGKSKDKKAGEAIAEEVAPEPEPKIKAGILTAGEVHDFSKWNLWQDIAKDELNRWQSHWQFAPTERYTVQLKTQDGFPVLDAEVRLVADDGKTVWTAKTDNTGKAELWANVFDDNYPKNVFTAVVTYQGKDYDLEHLTEFHNAINTLEIPVSCAMPDKVDIAFVVDATGSMGDEIRYLKIELLDVIERAKEQQRDYTFRLGTVFYRDEGDDYVTKYSPLSKDINKTVDFIKMQHASGGGDTPEAVDSALDVAINTLEWTDGAVARLLFLVLDAPPHHNSEVLKKIEYLSRKAAQKGIRIIPVTGSGIDKSSEYLMRALALSTNGTYTFLTDHSGVGNPHIEPTTDKYDVEHLNDLLVRLIEQYTTVSNCQELPKALAKNDIPKPDEALAKLLKYYPNPTDGPFTIQVKKEISELFITDMNGKILQRFSNLGRGKKRVDLSNYPSGTYLLRYPATENQWIGGQIVLLH